MVNNLYTICYIQTRATDPRGIFHPNLQLVITVIQNLYTPISEKVAPSQLSVIAACGASWEKLKKTKFSC